MQGIRKIPGVVRADALPGTPDSIAIVEGENIAPMDAMIDANIEMPDILVTDSRVAR